MIKRKLKEKLLIGFSAIAVSFMLITSCNMVTYASESTGATDSDDGGIVPYSDIIEYRYMIVDGTKLYRRLYNYSQEYWIGDWEYVGEGFIKPDM